METKAKLSVCGLGFGIGLTWAIGIFIMGLAGWLLGVGDSFIKIVSEFYIGYAGTLLGSFIGAAWAFIDGFIGGALVAFFYNLCICSGKRNKDN